MNDNLFVHLVLHGIVQLCVAKEGYILGETLHILGKVASLLFPVEKEGILACTNA